MTPRGNRVAKPATVQEWKAEAIHALRVLVRETGYHAARMIAEQRPCDESYSRSQALYGDAVDSLRLLDVNAEEFIARTYNPHKTTEYVESVERSTIPW